MTINKASVGVLSFLQIIILPLLYPGVATIDWSWQLGCALALVLALSLMHSQWRLSWWLIAAGGFGVLACVGQWRLLPLVIAQILLTALVSTQDLTPQWEATAWMLVTFFVQAFLLYLVMHTLTLQVLVMLGLVTLPVVVAIWGDRMPLVVMVGLLVVITAVGYWLQQFTLVAAVGTLIVATVTSSRFLRPRASWYAVSGIVIALIFILARLHG
ncbi:hypothetical protein [Lacticaseibacillus sp. GG6-2]